MMLKITNILSTAMQLLISDHGFGLFKNPCTYHSPPLLFCKTRVPEIKKSSEKIGVS